jgi:prolyl oligopeptidase
MECLTLHEAVPGHHLQISLAQEMPDGPEFRKYSGYTAYAEGWGLYSESLGSELGFYKDPYSRFGALTFEMWRATRLVVDTGMHAFGWTRQQAIEYMEKNTGKDESEATVEIDRYIVWPGQALAYKIGQLKIRAIRDEAQRELGDKFDIRAFHDALLGNGALPLDVLESVMKDWIATQKGK